MTTDQITASAAHIFRTRDDLAKRLARADGLIDGFRRSYARAEGIPFIRPESFRRECVR